MTRFPPFKRWIVFHGMYVHFIIDGHLVDFISWLLWILLVMANFGCQLDIPRKREPYLKNFLLHIVQCACLWGIFLVVNWYRYVHITVGGTNHTPVSLGYLRKVADHELRIKPVSSIPFQFLLQPPVWVPVLASLMMDYNLYNKKTPFLSKLNLTMVFITAMKAK